MKIALLVRTVTAACLVGSFGWSGSLVAARQPGEPVNAVPTIPARIGDPYPLGTCPISGGKLGSMGDPIVKTYDGREVRFCCKMCPPKFEKDLPKSIAKLDEAILKDQRPIYPLKTSIVTGKDLPEVPLDFVYGNRVVRLGSEGERAESLKEPAKYIAVLDAAVVSAQSSDYPLKACPVSKDEPGGDMGKPVDVVVAGRLIRLCCADCMAEVEKTPARFVKTVDDARAAKDGPSGAAADNAPKHDEPTGGKHDGHADHKE